MPFAKSVKLQKLRLAGHAVRMQKSNAHNILIGKPLSKSPHKLDLSGALYGRSAGS
jgi:hypothetical protein